MILANRGTKALKATGDYGPAHARSAGMKQYLSTPKECRIWTGRITTKTIIQLNWNGTTKGAIMRASIVAILSILTKPLAKNLSALTWTTGNTSLHQGGDDCDIFVMKSPYYTFGPFCSPCAPGAVYLRNGDTDGEKAYCFAPDWFPNWDEEEITGVYCDEKTSCPYPVFRVSDDVCVFSPKKND
jgi:hypothetical protein